MNDHHIAVIGIGCRFPQADDTAQFWNNIVEGRACFSDVPTDRWDHDAFYSKNGRDTDKTWTRRGGFIEDIRSFAAMHYGLAPRRLEVMDPQHRLLIEATRVAMQDAGYERRGFDRSRTGVYFGLSVSEYKNLMLGRISAMMAASGSFGPAVDPELRDLMISTTRHLVPTRAFSIAGVLSNMGAASVSQTFDFGGPSFSIDAACASASVAVHDAVAMLRTKTIDSAVAGGVYLNLTPDNLIGFTRVGAISPTGACRPFDKNADGFVQGDGVGVLFLKRLDDAMRDEDRVLAVIRGTACNNDGRGDGPMTPRVAGQLAVLRTAYRDADCSPASVAYFEAHGTGTSVGDPVEIESLGRVLLEAGVEPDAAPLIGSVKGNVGHTMSAAGIAGLIKAIKIVETGIAPPQPEFTAPHPSLKLEQWPLKVSSQRTQLSSDGPLRVGTSSFGFGGTNTHFVVESAPQPKLTIRGMDTVRPEAIIVSAPNASLLKAHVVALSHAVVGKRLADVAHTLNATRSFEQLRAVIVATSTEHLVETLRSTASALDGDVNPPCKLGTSVTLYSVDAEAEAPKVALLFPGQGAQKVGILADIKERFSGFSTALAALDPGDLGRPLADFIYPHTPSAHDEDALTATEVCQPAMAALGLALAQLLADAGVIADVSLGHSLGEFAAMANAGVMTAKDAVSLVAQRGRAMRDLALDDTGTMAAVMADGPEVEVALEGVADVWLANDNRPGQVTISGTTPGVAHACEVLGAKGLRTTPLSVSHAFHSPLIAGIRSSMEQVIEGIALEPPTHVVASCIEATPYGDEPTVTRQTMLEHATSPVRFTRGLEQARHAGASVFLQVGEGGMLTGFAKATLGRSAITAIPLAKDGDGGATLCQAVATLAAMGVPTRYEALTNGRVISLPETPLERQAYWLVRDDKQPLPKFKGYAPGEARFGTVELPAREAHGEAAREAHGEAAPKAYREAAPVGSAPSEDLVALFSKQAEVLQRHAQIIADQNRVLLGRIGATDRVAADTYRSATAGVAGATNLASQPGLAGQRGSADAIDLAGRSGGAASRGGTAATGGAPASDTSVASSADEIRDRVLDIVAEVSAFPKGSLRTSQKLVDELGFDSLMVADLGTGLDKAYPALGGLPQTLFSTKTTVGDLAAHVVKALESGATADVATDAPLSIYRVVPSARDRVSTPQHDVAGEAWLVTEDERGLGSAISARLSTLGAKVVRVAFIDEGAAPSQLAFDRMNSWPAAFAEGLAEALKSLTADLRGVVHTSGDLGRLHAIASTLRTRHLAVVTRLGGQLGLQTCDAPEDAALLGYTKALARERSDCVVRAIDVARTSGAADAEAVLEELLGGDLEGEVGLHDGRRTVPVLEAGPTTKPVKLGTVLVTGGAGEIGALVARGLAKRATAIALVGRRSANSSTQLLVEELTRAGSKAGYWSCDVADRAAVARTAAAIANALGPVTTAVHSAGLVDDRPVEQLSQGDLQNVLRVKVDGYRSLVEAIGTLERIVVFSSWAGRFGNAHQTAYAAANDLVDHLAIAESRVEALSIAWPPWSSTTMVASIPSAMRAAMKGEGVTFVDDDEGTKLAVELIASDARGAVLVGRDLPPRQARLRIEDIVSLERHPYLDDHRLKDAPLMPLASAADLLVHAAFEAAGPAEVLDLELIRGVEADKPRTIVSRAESNAAGVIKLQLDCDGETAYRAHARPLARPGRPAPDEFAIDTVSIDGSDEALPIDLATFYDKHTFHGPMLQGILQIERMTDLGIIGTVRPCAVADWIVGTDRKHWALDPLVVDSSFQLAGYWAWVHHQRAGFPVGFRRLVVARPFDGRPVRCIVRLEAAEGDAFSGTIRYEDDAGEAYAIIEGIEGRLAEVEAATATSPANGNGHSEVPVEHWDIGRFPEVKLLDQRLEMAKLIGLENPYFSVHEGTAKNTSVVEGVEMLNYSSYNYLGFSGHPEVVEAAKASIETYGTSVSASRVASGERPIHRELELGIAAHIGVEDSIVFVSGHATNVTTVGHMLGKDDIVIHDALIHDSILQGIHLSGAVRRPYAHEDMDALERLLSQIRGHYRRALICAEGIYSMDGDICNLPKLIELKKRYKAMLLIDEAHSIGVLGHAGRGVAHHFEGVDPTDVDLWMGTLSKSFASCGGYIAGSAALVRYLKYTAPGFVYSAGITPPNCAAGLKSLELMQRHPEIVEQLRARSRYFIEVARSKGIDTGLAVGAAVIPAIIGNSMECMKLSTALKKRAINVQPIVYPAVEDDAARLRFFLSATHTEEQIRHTIDVLAEELGKIRAESASEPAAMSL